MKTVKKIVCTLMVVIMCLTSAPLQGFVGLEWPEWNLFAGKASALAATGQCGDNVYWNFDESTGKLVISGTGKMYDYGYKLSPFYENNVKDVSIEEGVTSIGSHMFHDCANLSSVIIPSSVTSIGRQAFHDCVNLTSIIIPYGIIEIDPYAFCGCSSLTSIIIPDSVVSIGEYAFCDCDSLSSVYISNSVTNIEKYAFGSCKSLTSITVGENNESFSSDEYGALFDKDKTTLILYPIGNIRASYAIPDSVTSIGECAFEYGKNLTSITIPDSVTSICKYAFAKCAGLTSVTIPNSVTSICGFVFEDCTGLTSVTIPNSITSIGGFMFDRCSGLTSIEIPNSVTSIGEAAFQSCESITKITIPNSVTSIDAFAFGSCNSLTSITIPDSVINIGKNAFNGCRNLTSVTISGGVTTIGKDAFTGCRNLTSITVDEDNENYSSDEYGVLFDKNKTVLVKYPAGNIRESYTIPNSVTCIVEAAFNSCKYLTSITIPNSITTLENGVFSACYSLTSITIPDSVTNIGESAFGFCRSLISVTIPDSVSSIGDSAFANCKILKDVYYTGTEEQWDFIAVEKGNDPLLNATIHFNCCKHKNTVTYVETPATCTDDGYTTGVFCNDCQQWLSGHEVVEKHHTDADGNEICDICGEILVLIIKAGETLNVPVEANEITLIKFTPTATGTYTFTSLSNEDTYGYLYDENKDEITYNDDGGDGANFSITYDLKAGKTYYFGASYYSSVKSGSYDVKLTCDKIICEHENTNEHAETPATCTENGYTAGVFCNDCQLWISGHDIIRKHHTDTDGDEICDICGETIKKIIKEGNCGPYNYDTYDYSDNVVYTLYDDGELVISGEGDMADFHWNSEFPDTPYSSYEYDEEWETIYDNTVKRVVIEDGVTNIGMSAFMYFTALESVEISHSVTLIHEDAFLGCSNLSTILIPDSVANIGDRAFSDCSNLAKVTLSNNISRINDGAFSDCSSLASISIPNSVTSIGSGAFFGCDLRSVTIPNSVTSISSDAFARCVNLISVTIPKSVDSIGWGTFYGCNNITDVYYTGTEEQWDFIEIEEYNDSLLNATIHYNYVPCDHINTVPYDEIPAACTENGYTAGVFCNDCQQWISGHEIIRKHHTDIDGDEICDICGENTELVIRIGETLNITVNADEITYIKFVPQSSGRYTFSSSSDYDTIGYLFDSNKEYISSDDDSGEDWNFALTFDLEAGETYYWGAVFYSSSISGDFDVTLSGETHTHTPKTITIPASCTVSGMTYTICETCGETIGEPTILPAAHTPGEWETVHEPTITAEGKKVLRCTVCGEIIEEAAIPMLQVVSDKGIDLAFPADDYDGDVDVTVEESFDGTAFDIIDTSANTSQKVIYDIKMT
ncbi:MAG: leucine-rich repeat domain-containing protein, partial [Acutalibacteraceae bacterium]